MLMKGVFNGFDNITLSFGPQNRREGIIAPKKTYSLQPLHPSLSSSSITSILTRKIISSQHARHNTNYHKESDKVNKQIAQLLPSPEPAVSALELTMKILISAYSGVGINYSLVRWFPSYSPLVKLYNLALFVSDSDVETPSLKTHSVAYINSISCPLTSIPLIGCCTLPNFCPLNGKFIFLEVSNFASMWFILLSNSIFVTGILDLSWSRVSIEYWWKDEQFWVIGGTSTHPFAVLQGFLKMPARIDTNFTVSPEGFDENGVVCGVSCKFDIANSIIFVKRCKIIMVCNLHGIRLLAKNSKGYGFTRLVAVRLNNNGIGTQAYVDANAAGVLFLGREIVHMAPLRRGEADDVEIVGWGFDVILAYEVVYHGHLLDPMFELLCLFLNSGEDYTDFMVLKIKSLRSKEWELLPQTTNAFSSDSSLLSNEFHRVLKQKTREPNLRERLCLGGIYTQKIRTKIATVLNNMGVLTLKHEIGELWGEIFTASTEKDWGKVTSIKLSMHYIVGIAPIGKTLIPKSLMEKYELLKICDKCFQSLIIGDLFLKLEIEIEGVKYSNVKVKEGFCVNGVKLGEYGYSANIWLFNNLIDRNCKNRMLNEAKVLYGGMSDLRVLCRKIDVIKIWLLTFNLEDKVVHLGGSIDKVTISQPKVYSRKNKKGAAGESSEELSPTSPA